MESEEAVRRQVRKRHEKPAPGGGARARAGGTQGARFSPVEESRGRALRGGLVRALTHSQAGTCECLRGPPLPFPSSLFLSYHRLHRDLLVVALQDAAGPVQEAEEAGARVAVHERVEQAADDVVSARGLAAGEDDADPQLGAARVGQAASRRQGGRRPDEAHGGRAPGFWEVGFDGVGLGAVG